jgi:tRNA pseudouridine38-40 synthase
MKIVLKIGYIGTNYGGFQRQKNNPRTIQGVLEDALKIIFGTGVKVIGSGRTDKGVHSKAQMVQFKPVRAIETSKYPHILNNILPEDIRVYKAYEVSDNFHVQYSSIAKKYTYNIDCNKVPLIREIPFSFHHPYHLNLEIMKKAAETLIGTHDFTAYASRFSCVENRVRTIYSVEIIKGDDDMLRISIYGSGFLHNMVRIIVGTLIDIGRGTYDKDIFERAFITKKRCDLGRTAKAKGLMLEEIIYKEEF